jgi:hypothetical protein
MPREAVLLLVGTSLLASLWGLRVWLLANRRNALLAQLAKEWGRPRRAERDLDHLRESFRPELEPPGALDDGSWDDLLLDEVYEHVDRCLSTPGSVGLYRLLRTPLEDGEAMTARLEQLRRFESAPAERGALQLELLRLGRSPTARGLLSWVQKPLVPVPGAEMIHRTLALAALAALIVALVQGHGAWTVVIGLFFVNMAVHYFARRGMELHLDSLRELGRLVRCAQRVAELSLPGMEALKEKLRAASVELSHVRRASIALIPGRGGAFDVIEGAYDYLSIYFLVETRAFYRILSALEGQQPALTTLFDGVGLLDALQSAASFRAGMPIRCTPEFVPGPPRLEMTDVVHPLLEHAVPNSLRLAERSCLITGSNMSGKSTFLRAVGLNAVLAQTVGACSAGAWCSSLFRISTSIAPADDLGGGKSTFFVEAERLLRMVRSAEGAQPSLCLVDELLRGTNSVERLAAGEEIMDYLARQNALVVVATHDMELVERLAGRYDSYHFTDTAKDGALHFDHLLRPGSPVQRNAIRLLGSMGFPPELVERARARALAREAPPAAP